MILENDCTLQSYGIKPGVTIHVLEKKVEPSRTQAPTLSWAEVQQLVAAFRAFMLSSGCRAALQVDQLYIKILMFNQLICSDYHGPKSLKT